MELHPLTYDVGSRTWSGPLPEMDSDRTLILAIGAPAALAMSDLKAAFPRSVVVGCGAINPAMTDLTVTVARFDSARIATVVARPADDPAAAAEAILRGLAPHGPEDLRAVLVLGATAGVEDVVANLRKLLPSVASAGEQPDGVDAWVMSGDLDTDRAIVAVGLYGEALVVPEPPESAPDLLLVTLGEDDPSNDPDARLAIRTTTYDLRTRSWSDPLPIELDSPRTLVLAFGSPEFADSRAPLFELSAAFPRSRVLGCSGAGEIVGAEVRDGILSVAVARFVHTDVVLASANVPNPGDARDAGHRLAAALQRDDLRVVFVLSEGAKVDGAELVAGLCEALPPGVQITGGLAGDGSRFRKTWLLFDGELRSGRVIAVGLCGDHVVVGHGSRGGWEPFGPEHRVSRSRGNTVFELDGRPALDVYQEDLGSKGAELPGSALPFPLAVRKAGAIGMDDQVLFRTLLAIDERERSLSFAGDVPEGTVATLMRAEWNRLVDSAHDAATATQSTPVESDQLAIAVSGMGRRSVLGAHSSEELGAVRGRLPQAAIVGFYAYGELSPSGSGGTELQNHTMTLTTFAESPVAVVGRVQADGNRPAPTPAPAPPAVGRSMAVEWFANVPGMGWTRAVLPALDSERTLVIAVGGSDPMHPDLLQSLRRQYPKSQLLGWSAPGEQRLSVTVIRFSRTQVVPAVVPVDDPARSYDAGRRLGALLMRLCDGIPRLVLLAGRATEVRGAELTRGLLDVLGPVPIAGGLATADDGRPWVSTGDERQTRSVAAVALSGEHLAVGHAVRGGVDPFPPERVVTRANGNVLYELDGRPVLAVLRSQLGPDMEGPPTGHWFGIWVTGTAPNEVRRVMVVDEGTRSVALDQAVPTGARVHLVRDTTAWLAAEARVAAGAARASTPLGLPAALTLAIGASPRGANGAGRRDLSGLAEGLDGAAPVLAWTADELLTSVSGLGADGPVAVVTLAESAVPVAQNATDGRGPQPSTTPNVAMNVASRGGPPEALGWTGYPSPVAEDGGLEDELTADAPRTSSLPPTAPTLAPTALPSAVPTAVPTAVPIATPATATPLPARPSLVRGTGAATPAPATSRATDSTGISRRTLGGVEVVSVGARITEAFPGEKLGRELNGTVVIDLGRVERITSFGVREWLAALRGCRDRVQGLYLMRCTEPFVNQLTMIRGFAGHGQVISFYAPYVCPDCGTSYSALLDAERDRVDLHAMSAPKTFCPRCGCPGTFDDEEGSYFSMLGQLAEAVPPEIRRVVSALDPVVAQDAIEKRVDQDVTRISVFVPADGAVRWNQVLDGVEGRLVIDFTRCSSATAEGAETLERGLRRIEADVENVALIAVPRLIASRLLQVTGLPRIEVFSMMTEAHCGSCDALRTVLVAISEQSAFITRGLDPRSECPRCATRLSFEPSRSLLRLAVLHGKPGDQTAEFPRPNTALTPAGARTELLDEAEDPARVSRPRPAPAMAPVVVESPARGLWTIAMVGGSSAVLGVVVAATLVLLTVAALYEFAAPPAPPPAPPVMPAVTLLPPTWSEQPVALDDDALRIVGHATAAATEEAGLARARDDGLAVLVTQVLADLADEPIYSFVKARSPSRLGTDDTARVAKRYLDQMGTLATPKRTDRFSRDTPFGKEVWARYELPRSAYDQVVEHYRQTRTVLGATVAPFFPLLEANVRSSSEVVILSVDQFPSKKHILAGELIRAVGDDAVLSVDSYADLLQEQWDAAGPGHSVVLQLEENGATRQVTLTRPRRATP